MSSTGIRDLKNNLSRHLRHLKPGQVLTVTDRGRIVAEIRVPSEVSVARQASALSGRYADLVATGVIRPATESGDPLADWPARRSVPRGTVSWLIDQDRGE